MSDNKKPQRLTSRPRKVTGPSRNTAGLAVTEESDTLAATGVHLAEKSPAGVLASQLSGFRNRQELTAAQLAQRCAELGAPNIDRSVIAKIESDARGVSLDEAIILATALDVAPLHLIIPLNDDAFINLAPNLRVQAPVARQWVRGQQPLPDRDDKVYRIEIPDSEWKQQRTDYDEAAERVEAASRRVRVLQMKSRQVSADLATVEGRGGPTQDVMNELHNPRYRRLSAMLDLSYNELAEATVELEEARTYLGQQARAREAHEHLQRKKLDNGPEEADGGNDREDRQ